jgi:hypothetical protein
MQAGVGFRAYLFPGDRLYFAAIDLPHTPLNFLCPRSLDACITITFEGIEKHAGKFGALGFGKIGHLAKEFFDIP